MGLPGENRQCGICDQMVPSHVEGVVIIQFGKRRVFHEGCAKMVSESYKAYREEYRMSLLDTSSTGQGIPK